MPSPAKAICPSAAAEREPFRWSRSETIGLAAHFCASCHGSGLRVGKRGRSAPCKCVLRAIFRICYERFRAAIEKERRVPKATVEIAAAGKSNRYIWGRKEEEFIADFFLLAKRHLDPTEWDIFRFHFLLGADWKMCCKRVGMDRGNYFHAVYRIEEVLGQVFRETQPYSLFPLDVYFGGEVRSAQTNSRPAENSAKPLRPPLREK